MRGVRCASRSMRICSARPSRRRRDLRGRRSGAQLDDELVAAGNGRNDHVAVGLQSVGHVDHDAITIVVARTATYAGDIAAVHRRIGHVDTRPRMRRIEIDDDAMRIFEREHLERHAGRHVEHDPRTAFVRLNDDGVDRRGRRRKRTNERDALKQMSEPAFHPWFPVAVTRCSMTLPSPCARMLTTRLGRGSRPNARSGHSMSLIACSASRSSRPMYSSSSGSLIL